MDICAARPKMEDQRFSASAEVRDWLLKIKELAGKAD
jgi:hypothetical protein